jgi:hypothetical protein
MNGAGRCFDNIMVEHLWRTVKQDESSGFGTKKTVNTKKINEWHLLPWAI